ncbi:NADP-dependent phosphogluconate dehydrogenase [Buchnera aphidicola (Mindarus keteleerifoliae)]|uniref:NADP-dependent phosphogluconate dehydrogenase n=1 Tax=Buchnera aphidicola TaxID=9 RepID=UPI0031B6DFAE
MSKKQVGVIGMSVMGKNLALNLESKGYSVSILNRSKEKTKKVILENKGKMLFPYFNFSKFVNSLNEPKCIFLMVQSGKATDETISSIVPLLKKGDILIDGGNTFYKDTVRRFNEISKIGINFVGAGISGGEEGALKGPSIMPGGSKETYDLISPMLKKVSAKFENEPCVTYIGPNGAGHYVKMIHNGIEYGDMQLIAESYFLLKFILKLNNKEMADVFSEWNKGELNSYLIDITKYIFLKKDNKGNYLIDMICDNAENKGTGKWVAIDALNLEEPLSLITSSVFSRYLSSLKDQRMEASKILKGPKQKFSLVNKKKEFIEKIRKALYLGKIISYAQGFSQLKKASEKYNWELNFGKIAKIFRAGCIIRAEFLKKITNAYSENKNVSNLLLTSYFKNIANDYQVCLREVVSFSIKNGIAIPAFSSAISYYDTYRSEFLPANLIQAQRDFFGAHTYKRIDKKGIFHTNWLT